MKSTAFQIEVAKISRHTSDFKIYEKSKTSQLVRPKELVTTLRGVKFGWTLSTGLARGPGGELSLSYQDAWRMITDDGSIVMRFFKTLYDFFLDKKFIEFTHDKKNYVVTNINNVNGENIYMVLDAEFVK